LAWQLHLRPEKGNKNLRRRKADMLKFMERLDRMMAAATFAQANLHTAALEILHTRPKEENRKRTQVPLRRSQENRPRMRM